MDKNWNIEFSVLACARMKQKSGNGHFLDGEYENDTLRERGAVSDDTEVVYSSARSAPDRTGLQSGSL